MSLVISDIYKRFEKDVLVKCTYTFQEGKIYGIQGENGAGKTTLLRIIAGLYAPDRGKVSGNENVLFVEDTVALFEYLTGREYIDFVLSVKNVRINDDNISKVFEELAMDEYIDCMIKTYSKGMKSKVVMAIVLLSNPHVLLMDEPFVDLDNQSRTVLKKSLLKEKENRIVIFSTHFDEIASFADCVLKLENGQLACQ